MCDDTNDAGSPDASDRTAGADADPTTVRRTWEQSGRPSVIIVEAVAAATDRATTDLPLLQRSIDPDALDALLTRGSASAVALTFAYADTTVSVSGEGTVEVRVDGQPNEEHD